MRWLDDIIDSVKMNMCKLQNLELDRVTWHAKSPWGYEELDTTE